MSQGFKQEIELALVCQIPVSKIYRIFVMVLIFPHILCHCVTGRTNFTSIKLTPLRYKNIPRYILHVSWSQGAIDNGQNGKNWRWQDEIQYVFNVYLGKHGKITKQWRTKEIHKLEKCTVRLYCIGSKFNGVLWSKRLDFNPSSYLFAKFEMMYVHFLSFALKFWSDSS